MAFTCCVFDIFNILLMAYLVYLLDTDVMYCRRLPLWNIYKMFGILILVNAIFLNLVSLH